MYQRSLFFKLIFSFYFFPAPQNVECVWQKFQCTLQSDAFLYVTVTLISISK